MIIYFLIPAIVGLVAVITTGNAIATIISFIIAMIVITIIIAVQDDGEMALLSFFAMFFMVMPLTLAFAGLVQTVEFACLAPTPTKESIVESYYDVKEIDIETEEDFKKIKFKDSSSEIHEIKTCNLSNETSNPKTVTVTRTYRVYKIPLHGYKSFWLKNYGRYSSLFGKLKNDSYYEESGWPSIHLK